MDGTGHDGYRNPDIPNRVKDYLKDKGVGISESRLYRATVTASFGKTGFYVIVNLDADILLLG